MLDYFDPEILVDQTTTVAEREDCEQNLLTFLQTGWKYIDPAIFIPGWHLEAIAEHLQAVTDGYIQRLVINVPPRSSKSSMVSVAWPAWTWAQPNKAPLAGPHVQFLSASYAQTLSLRDSVKTRRLIQSAWYQKHWGDRFVLTGDQNAKHRFENSKGGYRLATSVDGTLTGEGGDCFPAGTLVSTPQGSVAIEQILVAQEVFAFDAGLGMVVKAKVVATKSRILKGLYEFHTAKGHRFACTANHPIYSPGRGYIRASEMGIGDLLVRKTRPTNLIQSDLYELQETDSEATLRSSEGTPSRKSRFVLFKRLQRFPFFNQAFENLCRLRQISQESSLALLLRRMCCPCARSKNCSEGVKAVSLVRQKLLRWQTLLQRRVSECCAFATNAWEPQFQIQGVGQIFQSVQGNWRIDTRARWPQVHGLWPSRQVNQVWQGDLAQTVLSSGPPHRRQHKEQRSRESDSLVSFLSQEAPSWDSDSIASIIVHGDDEHRVYDIQVERWHNFFAEGILVHNCIIIDDPHKAGRDSESEVVREATLAWWDEAMSTRLNNQATGAFVIVMQRLHMDDLTGHVLTRQQGSWTHLMLPMEYDSSRRCSTFINGEKFWEEPRTEDGELLCEARFPPQVVVNLKRDLGTYPAAGQLQQAPVPRGGGLIKDEWWKHWTEPKYPQCEFVLASLDTAYTEKTENDFSCLSVWGLFRQQSDNVIPITVARMGAEAVERWYLSQSGKIILLYQWMDRLNFPDLVRKVLETCTLTAYPGVSAKYRFQVDKLLIEAKAAGMSVAQELERQLGFSSQFGIELIGYHKGKWTPDKHARVVAVQHLFEQGLVYVPWPVNESGAEIPTGYKWVEDAMDQVSVFPKGKHDDFVDSMSMALRWFRDGNMILRPEEHARDVSQELSYRPSASPLYPV